MKEQQLGYTFWGRPLYGLERRTAVSIDCACGELIQQNIQTKQYHCKNCGNTSIKKTKKFSKNGKVAFETARGMIALEYGQVLLKLFPGTFMVISEEEFSEYFVEDESLVWMKKE